VKSRNFSRKNIKPPFLGDGCGVLLKAFKEAGQLAKRYVSLSLKQRRRSRTITPTYPKEILEVLPTLVRFLFSGCRWVLKKLTDWEEIFDYEQILRDAKEYFAKTPKDKIDSMAIWAWFNKKGVSGFVQHRWLENLMFKLREDLWSAKEDV